MPERHCQAVVVASSTGGVDGLRQVFRPLDPGLAVPIIVVQHSASETVDGLCELLAAACAWPVAEAEERQLARPGVIYLASPGYHLLVEQGGRFALSTDERVCYVRPSANVLFESAADVWGKALIAVVLSGANDDGAAGLKAVRRRGGIAVIQNPATAVASEMPAQALAIAGADYVCELEAIGALLNRLCGHGQHLVDNHNPQDSGSPGRACEESVPR